MVQGRFRSRTFRRIKKTTPGGKNKTYYKRRKPGVPQCATCGKHLKGTARGTPAIIQKLSKSERRPERPYGGVLCSACTKEKMIALARAMYKGE